MAIQSINFEQPLSLSVLNDNSNAMSIDLGLSICGTSISQVPLTNPNTQETSSTNQSQAPIGGEIKTQSKTPLLDKIEIDSDPETSDNTQVPKTK